MLFACWSVKGGSGTTVVAAALALLASRVDDGALLVDLAGELPAALGLPEPGGPGLSDWLRSDADPDVLATLTIEVVPGLRLLPRGGPGAGAGPPERTALLGEWLTDRPEPVVMDAGIPTDATARHLIGIASSSLLVLRPCYLALRRAVSFPLRPSGVVLVREHSRALTARDVTGVLGVPVVADLPVEAAVARAVDAGLLASRLPAVVVRGLRPVVAEVTP